MENLRRVFEKPREEVIDEQKLHHLASKVAIWDHFGIPQAHYLALNKNEKSKMLNKCYNNLLPIYFKDGKNYIVFSLDSGFFFQFWTLVCFWIVFENFILCALGEQQLLIFQIDQ